MDYAADFLSPAPTDFTPSPVGSDPYYASAAAALPQFSRIVSSVEFSAASQSDGYAASFSPAAFADASPPVGERRLKPQTTRRPLRVIHIGSFLIGAGIENWLVALIKYADPQRIQFTRCIVTTELVDQRVVQRLGVPVTIGGRDAVRQAAADADVLLVSGPADVGSWLADTPRPPTVFVAHGDGVWTQQILDAVKPQVDHIVAVSHRVREAVCGDFPTTVIHNGIDPAHLTQSRSREIVRDSLGFGPEDFVLGFIGRFSPEKNPAALVEAVARLPRPFKLMLIGFGVQRFELLDQTVRRIPGRYAIAEAHEHMGDYYGAMDALCLPSVSEGYGLVLMEAMMCGCPVISAPVGFAPETIKDRINGLIVDGTPEGFAEAARLLRDHPEWRTALALEGQRLAQRYGLPTRMAAKFADLLEQLCRTAHPVH